MARRPGDKSPLRGFPWKAKFFTKEEVDRYFSNPDGIQCLLCGRLFGTLNNHLQIVHGTSHEEYRARYGLPWRRGLVSRKYSEHLSKRLRDRIRSGSFMPKPDNKAAVAKIRAGGARRDQPYHTAAKSKRGIEQSRENLKYGHEDFENVLSEMLRCEATLNEVCMTTNLPSKGTVLRYAELNPSFKNKLLDTYYALPYAVQARADMFSPQFFKDLNRLERKGLNFTKIAEELQVSRKTVVRHLKQPKQT